MKGDKIKAGSCYRVATTKTLKPICRVIQGRLEGQGQKWRFLVEIVDPSSKRKGARVHVESRQFVEEVVCPKQS